MGVPRAPLCQWTPPSHCPCTFCPLGSTFPHLPTFLALPCGLLCHFCLDGVFCGQTHLLLCLPASLPAVPWPPLPPQLFSGDSGMPGRASAASGRSGVGGGPCTPGACTCPFGGTHLGSLWETFSWEVRGEVQVWSSESSRLTSVMEGGVPRQVDSHTGCRCALQLIPVPVQACPHTHTTTPPVLLQLVHHTLWSGPGHLTAFLPPAVSLPFVPATVRWVQHFSHPPMPPHRVPCPSAQLWVPGQVWFTMWHLLPPWSLMCLPLLSCYYITILSFFMIF